MSNCFINNQNKSLGIQGFIKEYNDNDEEYKRLYLNSSQDLLNDIAESGNVISKMKEINDVYGIEIPQFIRKMTDDDLELIKGEIIDDDKLEEGKKKRLHQLTSQDGGRPLTDEEKESLDCSKNDDERRKAYLKLSLKYHPDKGGKDGDFAELAEEYKNKCNISDDSREVYVNIMIEQDKLYAEKERIDNERQKESADKTEYSVLPIVINDDNLELLQSGGRQCVTEMEQYEAKEGVDEKECSKMAKENDCQLLTSIKKDLDEKNVEMWERGLSSSRELRTQYLEKKGCKSGINENRLDRIKKTLIEHKPPEEMPEANIICDYNKFMDQKEKSACNEKSGNDECYYIDLLKELLMKPAEASNTSNMNRIQHLFESINKICDKYNKKIPFSVLGLKDNDEFVTMALPNFRIVGRSVSNTPFEIISYTGEENELGHIGRLNNLKNLKKYSEIEIYKILYATVQYILHNSICSIIPSKRKEIIDLFITRMDCEKEEEHEYFLDLFKKDKAEISKIHFQYEMKHQYSLPFEAECQHTVTNFTSETGGYEVMEGIPFFCYETKINLDTKDGNSQYLYSQIDHFPEINKNTEIEKERVSDKEYSKEKQFKFIKYISNLRIRDSPKELLLKVDNQFIPFMKERKDRQKTIIYTKKEKKYIDSSLQNFTLTSDFNIDLYCKKTGLFYGSNKLGKVNTNPILYSKTDFVSKKYNTPPAEISYNMSSDVFFTTEKIKDDQGKPRIKSLEMVRDPEPGSFNKDSVEYGVIGIRKELKELCKQNISGPLDVLCIYLSQIVYRNNFCIYKIVETLNKLDGGFRSNDYSSNDPVSVLEEDCLLAKNQELIYIGSEIPDVTYKGQAENYGVYSLHCFLLKTTSFHLSGEKKYNFEIIFAFRGSQSSNDWLLHDLTIASGYFDKTEFASLRTNRAITNLLEKLDNYSWPENSTITNTYSCGHSLGGTMAINLAQKVISDGLFKREGILRMVNIKEKENKGNTKTIEDVSITVCSYRQRSDQIECEEGDVQLKLEDKIVKIYSVNESLRRQGFEQGMIVNKIGEQIIGRVKNKNELIKIIQDSPKSSPDKLSIECYRRKLIIEESANNCLPIVVNPYSGESNSELVSNFLKYLDFKIYRIQTGGSWIGGNMTDFASRAYSNYGQSTKSETGVFINLYDASTLAKRYNRFPSLPSISHPHMTQNFYGLKLWELFIKTIPETKNEIDDAETKMKESFRDKSIISYPILGDSAKMLKLRNIYSHFTKSQLDENQEQEDEDFEINEIADAVSSGDFGQRDTLVGGGFDERKNNKYNKNSNQKVTKRNNKNIKRTIKNINKRKLINRKRVSKKTNKRNVINKKRVSKKTNKRNVINKKRITKNTRKINKG